MIRTRLREGQSTDADFLSEEEGNERFLFSEGYGTNLNIKTDGYLSLDDLITDPAAPTGSDLLVYNKGGTLYYRNSSSAQTPVSLQSGTFTPTIKIGATTQSTSYNLGHYTKAGNSVTIAISVSFTKSGTGSLTIQNLPFVSKNITNLQQGLMVSKYEGVTIAALVARVNTIAGILDPNQSILQLKRMAGDAGTEVTDVDLQTTVVFVVTGTYLTD